MPIFSIVIPVYNAEKTIGRCINSITSQSFGDFEVLLIDDGSIDLSGEICKGISEKDERFVYLKLENGGVSRARNTGIDMAKGQYICFIDSDDYVEECFLQSFYDKCTGEALYLQSYLKHNENGSIIEKKIDVLLDPSSIYYEAELNNLINSPWAKMYSLDLVKRECIRFDTSLSYGEDHLFVLCYLCKSKDLVYIDNPTYHYIINAGPSLTRRNIPATILLHYQEKLSKAILSLSECFLLDNNKKGHIISLRNYEIAVQLLNTCINEGMGYCQYKKYIQIVNKWGINNYSLPFKQSIILFLIKKCPALSYRFLVPNLM
jgi:glycosyltransferase involved in cell wall biosynthesis